MRSFVRTVCGAIFSAIALTGASNAAADDELTRGLVAHWPLTEDGRDLSSHGRDAEMKDIDFSADGRPSASFNGRGAHLSVAGEKRPQLGSREFSISVWIDVPTAIDDVPGDIVSQYDRQAKKGFALSLKTNGGVTTTQANWRQLQFSIDDDVADVDWFDCGRPGDSLLAFALASYEGELYAGVCRPDEGQSGRVYKYAGDRGGQQAWIDCGAPDASNSVTALAEFDGKLYAATGKYRVAGSALAESPNANLGGRVFRYEGESQWTDIGQLPGVEAIGGLAVFNGKLYASSLYRPAGFFRYEGDKQWTNCIAGQEARVEALCVFNGHLYATSYDGGRVFRYDGQSWADCGQLGAEGQNTQTYAFAIYGGKLYAGTWPSGRVYRFDGLEQWADCGRLGEELEVMGMLVYNGRLLAGSLPLAQVYEYEPEQSWRLLSRLDHTPDVKYRRAWTMAEHAGRLYCSTLPSGKVFSYGVGRMAASHKALPEGWRHVAAVRESDRLRLFVDGKLAAESATFDPADYHLDSSAPLRIGDGPNDFFRGRMASLRIYDRAISQKEIESLAAAKGDR
jgi:hypothetical protein